VVLAPGVELDDNLTLSGKVLEVPVKRILMGTPPERAASVESLANPRSLDYFVERRRRSDRWRCLSRAADDGRATRTRNIDRVSSRWVVSVIPCF
jgi:hypothetical protein